MKNPMIAKNTCKIGAVLVAGLYLSTASAATFTWTGSGDGTTWTDVDNWNGINYAGQIQADLANITNGDTVTVGANVPQQVDLEVSGGSTVKIASGGALGMVNTASTVSGSSLEIASGGTLTRNGNNLFVRANGATAGVLKMTGGTFSSAAVGAYVFSATGVSASLQGTSRVELSGSASFGDANTFMYFSDQVYMDSVFSINGSGVTTGGRDVFVRPKYATSTSTLEFIMDASGVSSFDSTYKMTLTDAVAGSADLSVDVTGRGAGLFTDTLADYGSLIGTFGTIDVVGSAGALSLGTWDSLSAGEYAIDYAGAGGTIQLQYNAIPEPSSIALMGLALGALVMFSRRKRA